MHPRQLNDSERLRAKSLSPDTLHLFLEEIAELTNVLCSVTFPANAEEREQAVLAYVEAQAKRNLLIRLIQESEEAFSELSAAK